MSNIEFAIELFEEFPNARIITGDVIEYLSESGPKRRKRKLQYLRDSEHDYDLISTRDIDIEYSVNSYQVSDASTSFGKIIYESIGLDNHTIFKGIERECSIDSVYYVKDDNKVTERIITFDIEKAFIIMTLFGKILTEPDSDMAISSHIEFYTGYLLGLRPNFSIKNINEPIDWSKLSLK